MQIKGLFRQVVDLPITNPLRAAPSLYSPMFCVCSRCFCTSESTCQLSGKQHVCQLALAVCQSAVVASLAVEVVETDPAEIVRQR